MSDTLFNVQEAVLTAASASADVQAVLGSTPRLYDHVPPGAVFPYAVFGPVHVLPYDTKTEVGFEQIVTIDVFSRYRGGKEARDAMQALYNALHHASLSVSGAVFLSCEFHEADLALESDGFTYRAAISFSVITQNV